MIGTRPSLTGTIIKRELLTGLRSGRSFLLLLGMLSVMYGAAFYAMDAAADDYTHMATVMRTLFFLQSVVLGILVYAFVPAIAAVSVNSEREEENYDLLLTTLITPRRIILGKYVAVLVRAILIATAVLPFTGLVYFYAGVDLGSFLGVALVCVPAALCNAAVGIWCSTCFARPARAIFATFGIVAVMAGLIPVCAILYTNVSFLQQIPPLTSLVAFAARSSTNAYLLYMIYQLAAGGLFLMSALFSLRNLGISLPGLRGQRGNSVAPKGMATCGLRPGAFVPIPDGANPLGYKDLCGSLVRSPVRSWCAFLIMLGAYSLLGVLLYRSSPELIATLGLFERLFILIIVPPTMAVLLVKEREETTFDMLRMTLMGPVALLFGKFAALLRLLRPALLAILIGKCVFTSIGVSHFTRHSESISGSFYVMDLLLLPPHLILVILASLAGAALPKKLVPAICGAMVSTMAVSIALLLMEASMNYSMASDETSLAALILAPHLVLLGFAYVVELGLALTLLVGQWGAQQTVEVSRFQAAQGPE